MNTIYRYKFHHLLLWGLLFGIWYFFRFEDYSSSRLAFNITFLKVADLAFMVYVTNYLFIPKLLYQKKYAVFIAAFFGLVFCSSWLKMYLEGELMYDADTFNLFRHFKTRFYDNVIPHILLVSTGGGFKLIFDYANAQRRLGEMAKENAEAELEFLKSQINPHFVFNSLNAVYFLIEKQNEDARDALHKFSNMLRYQLYECSGHRTSIEKEIAYVKDYIDLQRLRRDEHYEITFSCGLDVAGFCIEPLLLIPFVENAFKHLSSYPDHINEVKIAIKRKDGWMQFNVTNTTDEKNNDIPPNNGIGLKNVKRRLELLYPRSHSLQINHTASRFDVCLEIKMDELQEQTFTPQEMYKLQH